MDAVGAGGATSNTIAGGIFFTEPGDRHGEETAREAWAVTHNERWLRQG
ncbi:hypothetical protein ACFVJ8_27935 [Streptomyces yangpuensis]